MGMEKRQIQLDLNKVRQNRFFVATPCYGGALTEPYFRSVIKLMTFFNGHKIPLAFGTIANESLVTRARNVLLAYFLKSDYTHLMFIDADIEFQVDDILKLYVHDKDVVVGAYPKKGVNWNHIKESIVLDPSKKLEPQQIGALGSDYAINFQFTDRTKKQVAVEKGLIKLHDAGTGFMMIKRQVILDMCKEFPELKYNNDVQMGGAKLEDFYAIFDTMIDPKDKRYLSEDYTFCRRWQQMGGDIWLDPSISLNHYGSFCFQGNPEMIIQFNEPIATTPPSSKSVTVDEKKEDMEAIDLESL